MPRHPRLFVSGGVYHVWSRTHRAESRFDGAADALSFIEALDDVRSTDRLGIHAWALMSNHYHLVVRTGDVQLWRSMARLQARVTRCHNQRCGVLGSGWQGRYRARLVQDDHDLRNLLAYVHLNPVVAGLVSDPSAYDLSGHRALLGGASPIPVDADDALRCFGTDSLSDARSAYLDQLRAVAEVKWLRATIRDLPWWRELGEDHRTVAQHEAPRESRTFDGKVPTPPPVTPHDLDGLLDRVSLLLGTSRPELVGAGRTRATSKARQRFAFVATCHFGYRGRDVAALLEKTPTQVSRWIGREARDCVRNRQEADLIEGVVAAVRGEQAQRC